MVDKLQVIKLLRAAVESSSAAVRVIGDTEPGSFESLLIKTANLNMALAATLSAKLQLGITHEEFMLEDDNASAFAAVGRANIELVEMATKIMLRAKSSEEIKTNQPPAQA